MRRAFIAATFVVAAFAGGCFIVTGSSDGYSQASLSSGAGCTSAADCADAGGGVCCAAPGPPTQNGIPTVVFSCAASCPALSIQICGGNSECNDGGSACVPQACRFSVKTSAGTVSSSVPFQSCGLINCTNLGGM